MSQKVDNIIHMAPYLKKTAYFLNSTINNTNLIDILESSLYDAGIKLLPDTNIYQVAFKDTNGIEVTKNIDFEELSVKYYDPSIDEKIANMLLVYQFFMNLAFHIIKSGDNAISWKDRPYLFLHPEENELHIRATFLTCKDPDIKSFEEGCYEITDDE